MLPEYENWLHMPQLLPKFWAFAILSAVPRGKATWGMCSKHCDTSEVRAEVLMNLMVLCSLEDAPGGLASPHSI